MPVSPSPLHSRTTACSCHPALTTIMDCSAPTTFASISIRKLAFMNSLVDIYARCRRVSPPVVKYTPNIVREFGIQSDGSQCFGSSAASEAGSIDHEKAFSREGCLSWPQCAVTIMRLNGRLLSIGRQSIRRFINISAVDFHRPTHPIPCQRVSPVYIHPISSRVRYSIGRVAVSA
jgi:hypothetical protein